MWWIILIAAAVIIIVKVASEAKENADKVTAQGGMRIKYRTLVNYALNSDPKARVVRESASCIDIGASSGGGQVLFCITHASNVVMIEWRAESPVFGKHKLDWQFDEFMDQQKMIEKIENDLGIYQSNVMQKYM